MVQVRFAARTHVAFSLGNFYDKVLVSIPLELIFHVYRHMVVSLVLLCLPTQLTTVSLDTNKD